MAQGENKEKTQVIETMKQVCTYYNCISENKYKSLNSIL